MFKGAGDIANGYALPKFPLQLRDGDYAIWKDLNLPSLQRNSGPIWSRDWNPERLLELTKRAEAA